MTLQESLAKLKIKIEGSMSKENVAIMHQATADLKATGIANQIIKVGGKVPNFTLPNQDGANISLQELVKNGPVVITFYRGVWCPYCNVDLGFLKRINAEIKELGATLISISPQTQKYNADIIEKQRLGFDLLSDNENKVAALFGLKWTMVDPLKSLYKSFGIHLENYNGDDSWTLPVPSRFIIDQNFMVQYAEYSVDYTQRPNPDEVIAQLKTI